MSIWEKLAAAIANVSLGATMGPRFGGATGQSRTRCHSPWV